ncbi:DUF480 domain-containing protein [Mangrovibacter plantisponsor]|uniref:Uncharacterized protein n=1 Tax=Mangrovibacter plantisponsor TaxID=451513 RepID=A0A317Q2A9_9ENTR|nr:DUF480 domain-containing protein [Mangrovibacter plantisponsor]PWW10001.1 hypothetical protein DES37_10496 [Mangrovibacter plantisponsor]
MKHQFSPEEARVIGVLLEKQVTTPEQYPLSLNAIVTGCNQKTNREPVMSLSDADVQSVVDELVRRHHVSPQSGFGNRVTKYEQRFCNSEFGQLKLSGAQVALLATLLLRGPQTPGELRMRAARMHDFADMQEVEQTLEALVSRDDGPMVVKLPREPGKREHRYQHLFGDGSEPVVVSVGSESEVDSGSLVQRVAVLEDELAALKARLEAAGL